MSASKSWLQNTWDTNKQTLLDPDKGLYELTHAKQAVQAARDVAVSVDGGAGELLEAIEKAIEELTEPFDPDRLYTGLGTLRKALAAHKARLTIPAPLAQLWENESDE